MKVKLQPPSGTELPAFNPIVHPTAITQVLLLANPQKVRGLAVTGAALGWGEAASSPHLTLLPSHLCPRRRFASATSSSSPWATRPTTRWGMWTSSPHLRPGGASRTERGWGEEEATGLATVWPGREAVVAQDTRCSHAHVPWAWCFSPPPCGPSFLARSPAVPNPKRLGVGLPCWDLHQGGSLGPGWVARP